MERDLLRQSLVYHGDSLFHLLKGEQTENPDFQAVVSDLAAGSYHRTEDEGYNLVQQFIARKADILFSPSWKTAAPPEGPVEEEATEPFAQMPPLELLMEVDGAERRAMLYRDLERGDALVGRINNVREYGFFLTLLCTAGHLERDIEDLELSALCHIKEIPSTGSHDDPLSYYQIGDLIRAGVKDIDRFQEKITVSLFPSSLSPRLKNVTLGVIAREELPLHYSRGVRAASDPSQSYEVILKGCHGYHNPSVVDYLLGRVGVSDSQPPSLMRGLQSKLFDEEDFASVIRKKQSASWALKCVRSGVDHFKHGRHVEAMNDYNKALELDSHNVEALVARGALYANKGSLLKAISDLELALEACPDHRNARKYLAQTLVERGQQLEQQEQLLTAEGVYRRAVSLDDSYAEAQEALRNITHTIQESLRLREEALAKEKEVKSQTSAEKLRKLLKEEKRMKKKRKRSSSPSSSTSSSSSSSSSHRKSKKKRKKRRRSDSGRRRHRRGSSRETKRSEEGEEEEEEWLSAPPNTSASFLNHRGGPEGLGEREEGEEEEDRRISQLYSLSGASEEEESVGSSSRGGGGKEKRREGNPDGRSSDRKRSRDSRDGRKEVNGGGSRRSSLEDTGRRRPSTSSLEAGPSHAAEGTAEQEKSHSPARLSGSSWRTVGGGGGRYEGKERRKGVEEGRSTAGGGADGRLTAAASSNGQRGGAKKDMPANLLDILNQIAQFEKERGGRPSK